MERLIVKQWEAFYEFFCRMRFLHGFVYSFDPSGLAGIIREKLKWYRWLLSLFFIWEVYGSTKIQLLYLIGYVIFAAYLVKIYLYLRKNTEEISISMATLFS